MVVTSNYGLLGKNSFNGLDSTPITRGLMNDVVKSLVIVSIFSILPCGNVFDDSSHSLLWKLQSTLLPIIAR